MQLLGVKKYPDKNLRTKCAPVGKIGGAEKEILENMYLTMRHFCGIGLAAPQVGIPRRLIVAEADNIIIKLADPEISGAGGSGNMTEGCLSVPGVAVNVKRAAGITVTGLNEEGQCVKINASGLLARVLQHEIDHLNGRLIVDYMTLPDKLRFMFVK